MQDNRTYGVPFHSSIPNGSVDGWRKFPPPHRVDSVMMKGGHQASQSRQSEELSENPIVSRYYPTSQAGQPPAKKSEPLPPSRTWSTIPSVQRESSHVRRPSTKNDRISTGQASFAPTAANRSIQSRSSDHSTLLTEPSEHERRFIEYPTPSANRAILVSSQFSQPHRNLSTQRTSQPGTHPSNSANHLYPQDKGTSLKRTNEITQVRI